MRGVRLLGLVPILIGAALILVVEVQPDQIEPRICNLARMVVAVPEACFRGASLWLVVVLPAAALIAIGLAWVAWWAAPQGEGARLSVKAPRLHQYPPQRPDTTQFCRVQIHNRGPATANNVHMRLLDIVPRPRHESWPADYPYPVARVGLPLDAPGGQIRRGGDEVFQLASGWKDTRGEFMAGLDTKSAFHNPTPIARDERWQLTYEVTADNAEPVQFQLEMFVKGDAVAVKRVTARAARAA